MLKVAIESQALTDGLVHSALKFHSYHCPPFITAWCLVSISILGNENVHHGQHCRKTVTPEKVTCPRCMEAMRRWQARQLGAPMPMVLLEEDFVFE